MFLSDFSVRRPVGILMLVMIIIVLGVVSLTQLAVDLLPEITYPMVAVMTQYEGVAPEEVEVQVTEPLEGVFSTIGGVKRVSSVSQAGLSTLMVEFGWGTNMDFAAQEIREKIDSIEDFLPAGIGKSFIMKYDPTLMPIIYLGVVGDRPLDEIKKICKDYIEPQLERVDGVATAAVLGGKTREIVVEVNRDRLAAHHLSLDHVVRRLGAENLNLPGGRLDFGGQENLLRTLGEFEAIDEIEETILTIEGGVPIKVSDVAQVLDTFKEERSYVRVDGQEAIGIAVLKQSGMNTVAVSKGIYRKLRQIETRIPADVKVINAFDMAEPITESLNAVKINALFGGIFAFLMLLGFLRSPRSAIIIGVSIPICIIATFTLMYFGKISFNMMSLGGFALGLGILVDNAIIVLENIFRHLQQGRDRFAAARTGAAEVGMAVIAATFTTMVVFLPVPYIHGLAGQIFRDFAMTVAFALLASLILALTLVPMLSSQLLKSSRAKEGRLLRGVKQAHDVLLNWGLEHRVLTVLIAVVVFAGSVAALFSPFIGKEFLPAGASEGYFVLAKTPVGTTFEQSKEKMSQLEQVMLKVPERKTMMAALGVSEQSKYDAAQGYVTDVNEAELFSLLTDSRKRTKERIKAKVREKAATIPGLKVVVMGMEEGGFNPQPKPPVVIKVGGKDLDQILATARMVAERIDRVGGVTDVDIGFKPGKGEFQVKVDRERAARFGLSAAQVANTLQTAVRGQVATRLRQGGEEIDVTVRLDKRDLKEAGDLDNIIVASPLGLAVPLRDVADIVRGRAPARIHREDRRRVVEVTANIEARGIRQVMNLWRVMSDIKEQLTDVALPPNVTIDYGGEHEEMIRAFKDLGVAFILAVILVYMVLAFLFESLVHPFTIMIAVPLSLAGVVLALLISRQPLCVTSIVGVVMLTGIAVNDAIVLIDYINQLRSRGMERKAAILLGGQTRVRPVLLTTLTTVIALLPSATGIGGEGSAMLAPMAVAVMGGLMTATLLTLVVIPVIYSLIDDFGAKIRRRLKKTR